MNLLASLRRLAALDAHTHFGRATLACHITKPALSNALRSLELKFVTAVGILLAWGVYRTLRSVAQRFA